MFPSWGNAEFDQDSIFCFISDTSHRKQTEWWPNEQYQRLMIFDGIFSWSSSMHWIWCVSTLPLRNVLTWLPEFETRLLKHYRTGTKNNRVLAFIVVAHHTLEWISSKIASYCLQTFQIWHLLFSYDPWPEQKNNMVVISNVVVP